MQTNASRLWSTEGQRGIPMWLPILAALLLLGRFVSLQFPEGDASPVEWVPVGQAPRMAQVTSRRIFYDFSAEWCGPCKEMDRTVFREKRIVDRLNEKFVPVRVVDRRQEEGRNSAQVDALQRRYSVQAFPTLVIASADGKEIAKMVGYRGRRSFLAWLDAQ